MNDDDGLLLQWTKELVPFLRIEAGFGEIVLLVLYQLDSHLADLLVEIELIV